MTTWTVRDVSAAGDRFALFPSMGEYPAYDGHVYDAFDAADDRHRAFREAIRAAAPGRVVVDIGTGRDALWAVEAAHAGARHVYAIEAGEAPARRAAEAVEQAGLGDRVTVLPGLSTEQTLPVRAEVCVSEIVGNIATAEGAVPILQDARARLCTDDCAWIPFRLQTWAAAVDLSGAGELGLAAESLPYLHSIFEAAGGPFDVRLCLAGPAAELLISSCAPVESVTFTSPAASPLAALPLAALPPAALPPAALPPAARIDAGLPGGAELRIGVSATMTGVLLWARVAASARGGREVDALDGGTRAWAPIYVPLPEPVPVAAGDHLTVALGRRTSDDGVHPDYEMTIDGRVVWSSPHHGGPFRGSDFYRRLFASG
jgi:protein arginine N-methyltransferase 1